MAKYNLTFRLAGDSESDPVEVELPDVGAENLKDILKAFLDSKNGALRSVLAPAFKDARPLAVEKVEKVR